MKSIFKILPAALMGTCLAFGFTSCSDDETTDNTSSTQLTANEQLLQEVLAQNVAGTINPTYTALADSCDLLFEKLKEMKAASRNNAVTDAMVAEACEIFLDARANYELSEAFLLGAADHFGIDPHIDSWPLDLNQLNNLLTSPKMLNPLDFENGDQEAEDAAISNTTATLGNNLYGFHGIEFILFRDGAPRRGAELNANAYDTWNQDGNDFTSVNGYSELVYATAVAGDLRNSVFQMELSWNHSASDAHRSVLDRFEMNYSMDSGWSYGDNMVNAGSAQSSYASVKSAVAAVLVGGKGALGICDEVGNTKINNPFSGADPAYIESPYSHESKTDFCNNIRSIENVWMGGRPETRNADKSFHAYFERYNPEINTRVETAIANAKAKIMAINGDGAFVDYINAGPANVDGGRSGQEAIDACAELSAALTAANNFINSNRQ